jgi:hypothetical protein
MDWSYVAGFYDGEGTAGFRVGKDKRENKKGQIDGWLIAPYVQISNTNLDFITTIHDFLTKQEITSYIVQQKYNNHENYQLGYYVGIRSYASIYKFLDGIRPYSLKKDQIDLIYSFASIRSKLPIITHGPASRLKKTYWTKELFLEALELRDKLKQTKYRRNTRHKYDYQYFKDLWSI